MTGVATTTEIDDAIRYGAGLRWSFMGTFLIYRMAGGEPGMRHFLNQFGPALKLPWTKLVAPELTDELVETIAGQSDDQAAGKSIRELETLRDDCLVSVLSALRTTDYAAGAVVGEFGRRLATAGASKDPVDEGKVLVLKRTEVDAQWVDYNGHMTEHRYLQVFGETTDAAARTYRRRCRLSGVGPELLHGRDTYHAHRRSAWRRAAACHDPDPGRRREAAACLPQHLPQPRRDGARDGGADAAACELEGKQGLPGRACGAGERQAPGRGAGRLPKPASAGRHVSMPAPKG
ncbi:MAG: hypothetical protein WDN69_21835 [Aliidongia sp.]